MNILKQYRTYIYFGLIIILILFTFGCNKKDEKITETEATNIFNEISKDIPSTLYLNDKLNLPNKYNDVEIKYSFDNNEYFNDEYQVVKVEQTSHKAVFLTININDYIFKKQLLIHQNLDNFFQKVANYVCNITENVNYEKDLRLETTYPGEPDLVITYTSSDTNFVTNDGKRMPHEYDEDVTITCHIQKGEYSKSIDYNFVSRGIPYKDRLPIVLEYIDDFFKNNELTENTKLPTTHPLYGGRIRWISEDPTIVYDYETIHLPKESKTTHLLAELKISSSVYELLTYEVNLEARDSSITDEVYAKTFLETVLSNFDDYLTLYDGSLPVINTDYILDGSKGEVPHEYFSDIVRSTVPQETLDKLLYEGYQMPNPDNVLWIVVHESGMTNKGSDALKLAQMQWNYAQQGNGNASWGYQVDDHMIYQSFPDTYVLWHATDGTQVPGGGNNNGIGIEMCINTDGIFNITTKNNARLMASLLIKYGLGMMNMKRHFDFYEPKICPQTLINDYRWYEYLMLVEREYISQTILGNLNISYNIDAPETKVEGVYDLTSIKSGETIDIEVCINGNTFVITSKRN